MLKHSLQPFIFYHFEKIINLFWHTQNQIDSYSNLIDKVIVIQFKPIQQSAYLIFSADCIQLYPQYPKIADVKIKADLKQILKIWLKKDDFDTKEFKSQLLSNVEIQGQASLVNQLMDILLKLDLSFFQSIIHQFLGDDLSALIYQIKQIEVLQQIPEQIKKTLKNLEQVNERYQQEQQK